MGLLQIPRNEQNALQSPGEAMPLPVNEGCGRYQPGWGTRFTPHHMNGQPFSCGLQYRPTPRPTSPSSRSCSAQWTVLGSIAINLGARGRQLSTEAAAVSSPDTSKGPSVRRPTHMGLALTLAGPVGAEIPGGLTVVSPGSSLCPGL